MLSLFKRVEEFVTESVFDDVPEFFHRVEFRTVGRQGNETDVWRYIGGGIALMEAGPVPDDHMGGIGITHGNMLKEDIAALQVYCRGVEELTPSSGNLQGPVDIPPLKARLHLHHNSLSFETPDPPGHRLEPVA